MHATLAVILARGLGTRLRSDDGATMSAAQAQAAEAGLKALMPLGGRPLLDYLLHNLADAGVRDIVLVVPPGDSPLRQRYDVDAPPNRLRVRYAVQEEPLGTANALLAARDAVCAPLGAPADAEGQRHFLMCNGDNLYSVSALHALVHADGPAFVAYEAEALVRESGIEAERVRRFALLRADASGALSEIVEKPEATHPLLQAPRQWVSMNLWRFTDRIFDACRTLEKSPRGEYELADAVRASMRSGERYATIERAEAVLDLTQRRDVPTLEARLAGVHPHP